MRITKSITFDAAHFLSVDSDERPYARMHGHSFTLEATIEGEPDVKYGWVADFADVSSLISPRPHATECFVDEPFLLLQLHETGREVTA